MVRDGELERRRAPRARGPGVCVTGGRGGLARGLGRELLARGLAPGGFACGLFSTSHDESVVSQKFAFRSLLSVFAVIFAFLDSRLCFSVLD